MKEDRESSGLVVPEGEQAFGPGPAFAGKQRGAQTFLGGFDLGQKILVGREIADELEDERKVGGDGRADGDHDGFDANIRSRPSPPRGTGLLADR